MLVSNMQGLAATSSILPGVLGVFEAVTQNEMLAIKFCFAKLTLQGQAGDTQCGGKSQVMMH